MSNHEGSPRDGEIRRFARHARTLERRARRHYNRGEYRRACAALEGAIEFSSTAARLSRRRLAMVRFHAAAIEPAVEYRVPIAQRRFAGLGAVSPDGAWVPELIYEFGTWGRFGEHVKILCHWLAARLSPDPPVCPGPRTGVMVANSGWRGINGRPRPEVIPCPACTRADAILVHGPASAYPARLDDLYAEMRNRLRWAAYTRALREREPERFQAAEDARTESPSERPQLGPIAPVVPLDLVAYVEARRLHADAVIRFLAGKLPTPQPRAIEQWRYQRTIGVDHADRVLAEVGIPLASLPAECFVTAGRPAQGALL